MGFLDGVFRCYATTGHQWWVRVRLLCVFGGAEEEKNNNY